MRVMPIHTPTNYSVHKKIVALVTGVLDSHPYDAVAASVYILIMGVVV